jgi:hypothetical protein
MRLSLPEVQAYRIIRGDPFGEVTRYTILRFA